MRRLTRWRRSQWRRRPALQVSPTRTDRGAVSVMVALLMVPLIGFTALAVDAASLYSTRQQLQTGADAAAMAIAQNCARNTCTTTAETPAQTATTVASANVAKLAVTATVSPASLAPSTGYVKVTTSAVRPLTFAQILGYKNSKVSTSATVGWGSPTGGTAVLPLAFSWCEFKAQTGGGLPSGTTERVIKFSKTSGVAGCTGPSNNLVPGGFAWVDPTAGTCQATSSISGTLSSSTGNAVPNGCSPSYFASLQNATVLLPIFDSESDSGTNAYYHIYAYAAFKITGYYFGGQYAWNNTCSGNDRCIKGYFTQMVSIDQKFTYTATGPQLGAAVVSLTQ